jgi:hypothetical protein
MWTYLDGVPQGTALGKRISDGLASAGLPGMRGLAPGIMEDAQSALDPIPIVKTIFGTGFPICKLESKEVGDQDGLIKNPATQDYYVQNPDTVFKQNGRSYQKRWAHDRDITQDEWNKAEKTHCANGYLVDNHRDSNCANELESKAEGFQGSWLNVGIATAAVLGVAILVQRGFRRFK